MSGLRALLKYTSPTLSVSDVGAVVSGNSGIQNAVGQCGCKLRSLLDLQVDAQAVVSMVE